MYEAERRIDLEWARAEDVTYRAVLNVYVDDRPGILNQLTSVLSDENVNIAGVESRSDANHPTIIDLKIDIHDVKQLQRIITAMRQVPSVREVTRSQRG